MVPAKSRGPVVKIATKSDGPAEMEGRVIALDRFSAKVSPETKKARLPEGSSVWLHFGQRGTESHMSIAGIVSRVEPDGPVTILLSLSNQEFDRLRGLPDTSRGRAAAPVQPPPKPSSPPHHEETPAAPAQPRSEPPSLSSAPPEEPPTVAVAPRPEPQPSLEQQEPRSQPSVVSLVQKAKTLAALGNHEGAWRLYYEALRAAPEDISIWFALGLTLSHLNRRKEADEIFQHVVRCGGPDSEEVKVALQRLIAGVLPEPRPEASVSTPAPAQDTAVVKGKITWGARQSMEALIILQGLDQAGPRFHTRVPLGRVYKFERLPAGSYHLIGGVGDHWLWDLRLTVEAGKEVVLDLSEHNSTNPTIQL